MTRLTEMVRGRDASIECSWRFDPADPVPTIGGSVTSGAPLMEGGAFDQQETAPLFGARDTDFTIKLIDVHPASSNWPNGFAMNLTDGILRLRFRESFSQVQLAQPGAVSPIEVTAFPTANRVSRSSP